MKHFEKVKSAIISYEADELSITETLSIIQDLTAKAVSKYDLDNYYASQDLENFCKVLCIEPIDNWQEIDDEKALSLIREILDNITDDAISSRNSEALEKRYGKSNGTVVDLIFHDNLTEIQVLDSLKKNNTIQL